MNSLYLIYRETSEYIDNDEEREWSESTKEWHPVSLHKKKKDYFKDLWPEEIQTELDVSGLNKVWMVVVRYFDGGTFGRTNGYWKIIDVYKTDEEAYAKAKEIKEDKRTWRELKKGEYQPWKSYFSGLEDVEVHRMEID